MKVLIIEDNEADLLLLQEALESAGIHRIECLHDGEHAIETIRVFRPSLIFLDLNLPKKDGFDILTSIKQDETLRKIPFIIYSSSSSKEDVERAYAQYANCYITKPFGLDQVEKVIASIANFWFETVQLP